MVKRVSLFLCVPLILTLFSCTKDLKINTLEPELALPFLNSRFDMVDLFGAKDSSEVMFDGNGQVSLVYRGKTQSIAPNEIFRFPELNFNLDLVNNTESRGSLNAGETATFQGEVSVPILTGSAKIAKVAVSVGEQIASFNSDMPHDVAVKLTLKESKAANNQPVQISASSTNAGQHNFQSEVNLANAEIQFKETVIEYNELVYAYEVTVTGRNGSALNIGDKISANVKLAVDFYFQVEGFGLIQNEVEIPEQDIFLRLFQRTLGDQLTNIVTFTDPSILFEFQNPHDVPGEINFTQLTSNNAEKTSINDIVVNGGAGFEFANRAQAENNTWRVDRDNSDIREKLTPAQDLITFKGSLGYSNASFGGSKQTITGLKSAQLKSTLFLPLVGFSETWTLADTVNIDFGQINAEGNEAISDVLFKINTENALPVDIDLQVYFIDKNNTIVDSLFNTDAFSIRSGALNGEGRVVTPAKNTNGTLVSLNRYKKIADNTVKCYVKASLQTGNDQGEVRLFSDNYFAVKLGVKSTFAIDLN